MFGIFKKLGGEQSTLDVIHRRRGLKKHLTHRAVAEWIWGRQIPALNIYHLTEECRQRGIPVSPEDFTLPKDLPRRSKAARDTSSPLPSGQGRARP